MRVHRRRRAIGARVALSLRLVSDAGHPRFHHPPRPPVSLRVAVLVIAISAPFALAFETLFRTEILAPILGPDFNMVRGIFSPTLTSVAWALVGCTALGGAVGVGVLPASLRRAGVVAPPEARGVDAPARDAREAREAREKRAIERLFLLTSIPQAPAILATFCFTFGALLLPVVIAMALSTLFVLLQGIVAARLLRSA